MNRQIFRLQKNLFYILILDFIYFMNDVVSSFFQIWGRNYTDFNGMRYIYLKIFVGVYLLRNCPIMSEPIPYESVYF